MALSACADLLPPTSPHSPGGSPDEPGDSPPASPSDVIFVADADGSDAEPLTEGSWPSWSPDGLRLVFHRAPRDRMPRRDRIDKSEIHVLELGGSGERFLGYGMEPSWSPDGERIVFTSTEGIAIANADGSAATTLLPHDFREDTHASDDMGVGKPVWSPDGTRIAFEHLGDGYIQPAQVFLMDVDGSDPRRLTATTGTQYAESDPAWSPDGSKIAFWSYGHGIAMVGTIGGVPTTIHAGLPTVNYYARPTWSPDGDRLAFAARQGDNEKRDIWVIPVTGGSAERLVSDASEPSWSPDGRRLAFVRPQE